MLSVWQFYRNQEMRGTGDEASYFRVADTSVMSKSFWCGADRPSGLPLVYKIVDIFQTRDILSEVKRRPQYEFSSPVLKGLTPHLIGLVQLGFSIIAFSYLAVVIANGVKITILKPVALILILLYSFTNNFTPFIKIIESESISSSLFICVIASWILFLRKSNIVRLIVLLLTSLFFAAFRDANTYFLLIVACVVFLWLIICWVRRIHHLHTKLLSIAIVYVVIFLANDYCLSSSKRWLPPFYHNLSERILTNNNYIDFFRDRGMPVNDALMHLGEWVYFDLLNAESKSYYNSPEQSELIRKWVTAKGKSTYVSFLLQHPAYTLKPIRELPFILTADMTYHAFYEETDFKPFPVIGPLIGYLQYYLREENRAFLKSAPVVLFCVLFFVILSGVILDSAKNVEPPLFMTFMGMILTALPHFLIAWHSDSQAVVRHSLLVVIQFQFASLMLTIFLLDSFLQKYCKQKSILLDKTE
jgi:hypothetical protein